MDNLSKSGFEHRVVTEFQELMLRISADGSCPFVALQGPSPAADEAEKERSRKHLAEAEELLATGWVFRAHPETYTGDLLTEAEGAAKRECTFDVYIVTDTARKLFKTVTGKPN